MRSRRRRLIYRWIVALLILGAVIVVVKGRGEERAFAEVVRHAKPLWLLVTVALQIPTYLVLALLWARVIRRTGDTPPTLRTLAKLALAELFTDQAFPSAGVGGTVLVVSSLRRRGVSSAAAVGSVVASLLGFYIAQLVAVLAAGFVLVLRGHTTGLTETLVVIALVAAIVTPLPTLATSLGVLGKLPRVVQSWGFVASARDAMADAPKEVVFAPRVLLEAALARLLILVLDAGTLVVALAAVAHPLPVDEVFVAYVLAFVVSSITFLPGGLGSFEIAATALLVAFGAPLEAAAPATLLMRGFTFWLPMIPGLWLTRHEVAAHDPDTEQEAKKGCPPPAAQGASAPPTPSCSPRPTDTSASRA